jgi:tetratricopeptide (TPR) repeat protein
LPTGGQRRLEHLVELGYALYDAGELERARATFSEGIDEAGGAAEPALESRARVGLLFVDVLTGGEFGGPLDAAKAEVAKLEELEDDAGLAEAWHLAGMLESWLGNSELGRVSSERVVEHARRAGNRRLVVEAIGFHVMLQSWGCTPASDGLRECDELLAEHAGTSIEGHLRVARALHLSFLGEVDAARREHALGADIYHQFGNELLEGAARMAAANEEIRAGQLEVAEAHARDGVERLERLGEQGFLSSMTGQLAEALYRQGRYDEAEEAAQRTAELAMADDFDSRYHSRTVQARVHARRGEFDEAERLAREAVDIAGQTDWYAQRGEAAGALGEVLELAGRRDEARAAYEQAVELFERKGSVPDADSMRRRLADLG